MTIVPLVVSYGTTLKYVQNNESITGKCKKHNSEFFGGIAQKRNRQNQKRNRLRPINSTLFFMIVEV